MKNIKDTVVDAKKKTEENEKELKAHATAIAVLKVKSGFIAAISGFFAGVGGAIGAFFAFLRSGGN